MFSPDGVAGMLDNVVTELHTVATLLGTGAQGDASIAVARINLGLDGMRTAGAHLRAAATSEQSRLVVMDFLSDANSVLAALAILPLPPKAAAVLRIVQLLLPAIGGAAAVLWPAQLPAELPHNGA